MRKVVLFLLLITALPVFAQQNFATGTISSSGTDCSTATNCVILDLAKNTGGVSINVSGSSFSGTLQFEATVDGSTWVALGAIPAATGTAVTSTTATGVWSVNVSGLNRVRVRASALTANAVVTIQASTASASRGSGSAGGGNGPTGVGLGSSVFVIQNANCNSATNCLQWTDDDSTNNCGSATTAFMASINAYAGPGAVQVFINGSGTGKAYLLSTCQLIFNPTGSAVGIAATIHLNASLDAGTNSSANLIQFGDGTHGGVYRLDGGTFLGGASLTVAGIEIKNAVGNTVITNTNFFNFGAGNATLGSCTNYAIQFDDFVFEGTVSYNHWNNGDATTGRCFANVSGATVGENTIFFSHNTIGGRSGSFCASQGIVDGGWFGSIDNNNIGNIAVAVRLQGGSHRLSDNELDSEGCVASGVNAAIQWGANGSSTDVDGASITDNLVQIGTGHLTNFMQQAGNSTASISNVMLNGNASSSAQVSLGVTSTQGLLISGNCIYACFAGYNKGLISPIGGTIWQTVQAPISDVFSSANGRTVLGLGWTVLGDGTSNIVNITSNTATNGAAQTNYNAFVSSSPPANDQFSRVTVANIDSNASSAAVVATNMSTTAGTEYIYYCGHVAAKGSGIGKFVAGSFTGLSTQTSAVGCNAGDTIELRHIGAWLYGLRNGSIDKNLATNPVTDAAITGGYPGIGIATDAANATGLTNWTGGSFPLLHATDTIYDADSTFGIPQKAILTVADYTNAGGAASFTSIPYLSFPVAANTNYTMHCSIVWSASAATTGPEFQITGPSSPTSVAINMVSAITATTTASAAATAFSSALNPVGATVTTATNEMAHIDMGLVNGANAGTVQLQASGQGTGTLTIRQGSSCTLQ
jgi:hypothetical protein